MDLREISTQNSLLSNSSLERSSSTLVATDDIITENNQILDTNDLVRLALESQVTGVEPIIKNQKNTSISSRLPVSNPCKQQNAISNQVDQEKPEFGGLVRASEDLINNIVGPVENETFQDLGTDLFESLETTSFSGDLAEIDDPIQDIPCGFFLSPSKLEQVSIPSASITPIKNEFVEFDPLAPSNNDWMMNFESPSKPTVMTEKVPKTPPPSLLDRIDPIATPSSLVKYSEKDMENLRNELNLKFEKEFGLAQMEIQDNMERAKSLDLENKKMKETLCQWEKAVKIMISDREKERALANEKLNEVTLELEKNKQDNSQGIQELNDFKLKHSQLKMDYNDLRQLYEKQRDTLLSSEADLNQANSRFESLKQHAESKLNEANIEIAKVRATYEKEISALKAKLSKTEVQLNTLDRALKSKVQENVELSQICDGLVSQIESLGG